MELYKKNKIKTMNIEMSTNAQQSTTESKKQSKQADEEPLGYLQTCQHLNHRDGRKKRGRARN